MNMAYDPEVLALLQRAQHVCADMSTVYDDLAATRAETQRLVTLARQGYRTASGAAATATILPSVAEVPVDEDPHALAMEVLRMMRELLNGFSAEWQVKIVKAITARTMLVVAAQLQQKTITPAA